jgi:hypothetical protein
MVRRVAGRASAALFELADGQAALAASDCRFRSRWRRRRGGRASASVCRRPGNGFEGTNRPWQEAPVCSARAASREDGGDGPDGRLGSGRSLHAIAHGRRCPGGTGRPRHAGSGALARSARRRLCPDRHGRATRRDHTRSAPGGHHDLRADAEHGGALADDGGLGVGRARRPGPGERFDLRRACAQPASCGRKPRGNRRVLPQGRRSCAGTSSSCRSRSASAADTFPTRNLCVGRRGGPAWRGRHPRRQGDAGRARSRNAGQRRRPRRRGAFVTPDRR